MRKWPGILHTDLSCESSELRLWFVDFSNFGIILTSAFLGQIWGFWSCSVDFPHYGAPLTQPGHIWGFWALSGERVGVNVERVAEAYFRRFASSSV